MPASLLVFTSTAVGGLGSALGAILGAALVEGSTIYLPPSWQLFPAGDRRAPRAHPVPAGLAGLCFDLRDWVVDALTRRHEAATPGAPRARRTGARAMRRRLAELGAGVSLFPLGVLFGIELLDQATQSAFNVLTPNVRDAFHLTNAGILLIVAIAGAAGARSARCRSPSWPTAPTACASRSIGAAVGAAFSIGLGASPDRGVGGRHAGRRLHGAGRDLPHPQLAAGRLLPGPGPPPRLLGPPLGHQHRRHRRRAPRRRAGRHLVLAHARSSSSPCRSRWSS